MQIKVLLIKYTIQIGGQCLQKEITNNEKIRDDKDETEGRKENIVSNGKKHLGH